MWNIPSEERLAKIPKLYETDDMPLKDTHIHLHFFMADSEWFITEYDGSDLFFGYAILNGDYECAEWGYISFQELKGLKLGFIEVDCELEELWAIKPASEIEKIRFRD